MTVFFGKLMTLVIVSLLESCIITMDTHRHTHLIPPVMVESVAVLFHKEMISSLPLTDITAPQISFPTMNCSPMIASS